MVISEWLVRTEIEMIRIGMISNSLIVLSFVLMYSELMRLMLLLFLSFVKNVITELN